MARTEEGSARKWAFRALARRMHTAREIKRGLEDRGWPPDTVRGVLEDLREQGYLDDWKFAEEWVAVRSEVRLHGPLRLLRDLLAKGVGEETAKTVIGRLLPRSREVELARRAAEKKSRTMRVSGIRAAAAMHRYLRSKGFSPEAIRTVLSGNSFEEEEN